MPCFHTADKATFRGRRKGLTEKSSLGLHQQESFSWKNFELKSFYQGNAALVVLPKTNAKELIFISIKFKDGVREQK